MTRNYMHQWRLNRILANDPCECGGGPRIAYEKGCVRCEAMDQERYRPEQTVNIVRRKLARFDLVSLSELADTCGMTETQVRFAMRRLIDRGEVETVGASVATEYRLTKRRAA